MDEYTFYWLDGTKAVYTGEGPACALNHAGYGNGAIKALDFFAEGNNNDYQWDSEKHTWVKKE